MRAFEFPIKSYMSTMHTLARDFPRQRLLYHGFSGKKLDRRASCGLLAPFGVCFFSSGTLRLALARQKDTTVNERNKLAEARHFLGRMQTENARVALFTRELSAFLGAARSVLQYALEEARLKPGGQQWYQQATTNPLISFFKQMRDTSVHVRPIVPVGKVKTEHAELLNIGDDEDEFMILYPHTRVVLEYEFSSRPGEGVVDLSMQYLTILEALVEDGVVKRWISG